MMAHRNTVHALPWTDLQALWLVDRRAHGACCCRRRQAQAAKPFPVDQFSYYLSDYDYELAKLAKDREEDRGRIADRHPGSRNRRQCPADRRLDRAIADQAANRWRACG